MQSEQYRSMFNRFVLLKCPEYVQRPWRSRRAVFRTEHDISPAGSTGRTPMSEMFIVEPPIGH
jgi:hypothetical protein